VYRGSKRLSEEGHPAYDIALLHAEIARNTIFRILYKDDAYFPQYKYPFSKWKYYMRASSIVSFKTLDEAQDFFNAQEIASYFLPPEH